MVVWFWVIVGEMNKWERDVNKCKGMGEIIYYIWVNIGVEREREIKGYFWVFGLCNWVDGVVIFWEGEYRKKVESGSREK